MLNKTTSNSVKKTLFVAAIALATFSSCKKTIDSLPAATQTGANTFGTKINGDLWGPLGSSFISTIPILEARFGGNSSIFINARNFSRSPIETEMEIYLKDIKGTGTIQLNQNTQNYPNQSASYAYYVKRNITLIDEWITGAQATGQVTITKYDVTNHVIAGTFQFTANALHGSQPVTVTEGRFDVKIQ